MSNEVIIDGCNVAECEHFQLLYNSSDEVELYWCNKNVECKDICDCDFKQLQRLKEELTVQKAVAKGFSGGLAQTEKLLEKAKAENEELRLRVREIGEKMSFLNADRVSEIFKYKKALEEIRDALNQPLVLSSNASMDFAIKKVIKHIDEVLEDVGN